MPRPFSLAGPPGILESMVDQRPALRSGMSGSGFLAGPFYVGTAILAIASVLLVVAVGPSLWPAFMPSIAPAAVFGLAVVFWLGTRHARMWREARVARVRPPAP